MPSMQDKIDLVTWVEKLPERERLAGYEAVLKSCAERYGNQETHLMVVLNAYLETFKQSLSNNVKLYREKHAGDIPDPEELGAMFDRAMEAVLLRMWTYANEHYQRYQAEFVFKPVDDDLLGKLLQQANEDSSHETEITE